MCVWSTPTIIYVWSVICINFYIVLSFTIFYDFSSNIQNSLRNVSLECIIFMNFCRVIPFTIVYDFYDFSSNIQTNLRNIKQPLKHVFIRVYIHYYLQACCTALPMLPPLPSVPCPCLCWTLPFFFSFFFKKNNRVFVQAIICELSVCALKRYFVPFFVKYT